MSYCSRIFWFSADIGSCLTFLFSRKERIESFIIIMTKVYDGLWEVMVFEFLKEFIQMEGMDAKKEKVEKMGFDIGVSAIDRMTFRNEGVSTNEFKIMEMICLEFWPYLFTTNIKNYKTDRKGSFIIEDDRCTLL